MFALSTYGSKSKLRVNEYFPRFFKTKESGRRDIQSTFFGCLLKTESQDFKISIIFAFGLCLTTCAFVSWSSLAI